MLPHAFLGRIPFLDKGLTTNAEMSARRTGPDGLAEALSQRGVGGALIVAVVALLIVTHTALAQSGRAAVTAVHADLSKQTMIWSSSVS
jgi:hypothetical protein